MQLQADIGMLGGLEGRWQHLLTRLISLAIPVVYYNLMLHFAQYLQHGAPSKIALACQQMIEDALGSYFPDRADLFFFLW